VDFELTAEQVQLKDSVRRYMTKRVAPIISDYEKREEFAWELIPELKQFGYLGGMLPEEDGGMGVGYLDYAMLMEEAGYQWMALRATLNTMNMVAMLLHTSGTDDQKKRFLEPLLAGQRKIWLGVTEPNHGSNVSGVETKAVARDDHYLVNGSKLWITNGIWGDFGILVAKTYSSTCDGKISLFLVDREETTYDAQRVSTMIARSTGTSALSFSDAIVPKANLLGREGDGLKMILTGLSYGRLSVAMGAVGAGQAALDLSTQFAKDRKQFGRAIGSFQLIQKHIVDMTMRVEAARLLGYRAAMTMDQGKPSRLECSIAKLFASEAAHEVASMAMQIHGGMGYSLDYPIERIFRDTRGAMIPEGTSEIQTLVIGREILGLSAFT
jgi:acyl-CoA dehydrogenase